LYVISQSKQALQLEPSRALDQEDRSSGYENDIFYK